MAAENSNLEIEADSNNLETNPKLWSLIHTWLVDIIYNYTWQEFARSLSVKETPTRDLIQGFYKVLFYRPHTRYVTLFARAPIVIFINIYAGELPIRKTCNFDKPLNHILKVMD